MNPEYSGTPAGQPEQQQQAQQQPSGPSGPGAAQASRRAGKVVLAVAGWLVIASGTAGAVVAAGSGGSGGSGKTVAGAAASPSAVGPSAGGPSGGGPSAHASASPTPSPTPTTASPTPSPSATVKGSVSGNSHSGDLRFFLLPVPDGAQVEGDPNGVTQSLDDIAKQMDNTGTSRRILNDYGCQGGAYRSYVTNDGVWTVTVHLVHFDGSGHASDWVSGLSFGHGDNFDVSGISSAKGRSFPPSSSNGGQGLLLGVSHVGDVEYEIDITGAGSPSGSLLTQLMQRQEQRLTSGV